MLIINDGHLCLAGVCSLDEVCSSCGRAFAQYPLIMSDDAAQTVYHAACALQLATEILVDLFTFFHPPEPHAPLFTLTATSPTQEGGSDALNGPVRHDAACVKWSILSSQPSVQGCLQSLSASLVTVG
jgi:hypothetical protein